MVAINDRKALQTIGAGSLQFYHLLIDLFLKASWKQVVDVVPENSKVFEAGCSTGGLAFLLRKQKHCQVVGADLSLRMLDFATKSNPYDDIKFLHMDSGEFSRLGSLPSYGLGATANYRAQPLRIPMAFKDDEFGLTLCKQPP